MPRSQLHRPWCAAGSPSPGRGDCTPSLADVLLHHVGRPVMRLRRVVTELAQRAALAQEIPVLVELHLQRGQMMRFFGRELAAFEEAVLFSDQGLDMREYGCILVGLGHGIAPRGGANIAPRRAA